MIKADAPSDQISKYGTESEQTVSALRDLAGHRLGGRECVDGRAKLGVGGQNGGDFGEFTGIRTWHALAPN